MKKLFLLLVLILSLNMGAMAQVAKTINVITEGTLSTLLTANEQSTVTNLTVTGNINSDDFAFMNSMTNTGVLVAIDLGEAIVNGNTLSNWVFASCSKLTTITIPDAVTAIGTHAFEGCSKLNSVSIPNSVTSIGDGAFQLCRNLTSVTIPNSVTSIGDDAFGYCSKLTSIIIPNSVTYIGLNAFYNCLYLTSVTIPNSVTSIEDDAFKYCSQLSSIKVYNLDATKITLGSNVFQDVPSYCTLIIPYGSQSSYQAADQWKDFTQITTNSVLSTNASTASLDYIAGSSGSIDITSNTYWKATSSQSWLKLSANPSNYYGNGALTFTASANIATTPRTAIVTLTTWDNSVTQTITVTQKGTRTNIGTTGDPYLIYTYDDLKAVSNNLSATYRLMTDIDASASKTENLSNIVYQGFTPIGTTTSKFTGTFHGHGHVIKNLYINRPSTNYVGLFGCSNGATIDSLGMVNGNITGGSNVGGLVGQNGGAIKTSYSTGSVSGSNYIGGLVGLNNNSTISTSYSMSIVSGTSCVGGLLGYNNNNSSINTSYSTGSVSGTSNVGGLAGYNDNTINTSYWDKETSGTTSGIGSGSGSATGLTTAQMKKSTNLTGLADFTTTWEIRQDSTYAALRGIDNAPFAFRDTLKGNTTLSLNSLLNNDYDYETKQTALVYKVQQIYGTGTVDASGTFSFPSGSVYGYTDSIRYRVGELLASGDTLWGNEAKAILIKTNVAPLALNDTLITSEDIAITHPFSFLLQNDTDNDVLNLTSFVAGFPHHGTLTSENGSFIYTPTANWNGTDSLQYVVSDGLLSDTALVIISVTPVNDAPVISSAAILVATEEVEYTYTVAASDAENDALSYSLSDAPAGMSITGNVITWTPAEGILSSGEITLTVNDGLLSTTQTFTITVTPVNDAPVISSTAIVVATEEVEYTYTVAASDAENDALSYSLSGAPAGMTIAGNVITWTPAEGILSSGNVTLTVNDGLLSTTQTFTIAVTPVNDAPVISSTAIVVATEEVEYTYTVAASDAENDALSYSLSGAPTAMSITGNVITWTPAGNILTSGEITLTVSDGLLAASQTFTITVTPQAIVMATLQTPTAGCAGNNIDLSYMVLNGSPTQYRIIYDASALSAGFANIDYSSLPSTGTVIGIPVPSGISEGTYQASLQTRNSLTESVAYPFSFSINLSASYLIAKFNDVILVDNSSNRFTAYQWYKDGSAISGATGQYYNDLQGLSGAYYALVQTATGESLQTCPATFTSTIKSAQVSLSAFPSPAASGSTISVAIEGVSDSDLQGATMDMINSTGATVYRSQTVTTLSSVTLNQAQGTYVIRVTLLNGNQFTHKIIVIK